jgi:hypothetical protein
MLRPVIDVAKAEPIRVRMLRERVDLPDDHVWDVGAAVFDAFDLDAGKRQQIGELIDVRGDLHELS